jgi:hypothetical protein
MKYSALLYAGFGFVITFIGFLQNVNTRNYKSFTDLHALKITAAHMKLSMLSLVIAW